MSEDAAWTKPLDAEYSQCLPKNDVKVLDTIVFAPDTTDFTPIFNKIVAQKPDVIVTGISHAGVQPTVQWKQQQVPLAMFGTSSQATNSNFWRETNGAAEGVIYFMIAAPNVATTPKTIPFAEAFKKKFGAYPSYAGYPAYDQVYYIADAVKRAGSTDADKLVEALEKTDYEGTIGRIQFQGKDAAATHSLKTGPGFVTGVVGQWQDGNVVALYPQKIATGKIRFPSFVKIGSAK
jgi:branched-chain amino acid transport system substrate-binding protein